MSERRFGHSNNPSFQCSESVILLPFGRRSYLPAAVQRWFGEELPLDETTDRQMFALRRAPGGPMLLYSGMGGPAAANALEMVAANGARRVVLFGACGGVDASVGVGDLVVPSAAVRGEGTSAYYAPPAFPAALDPVLVYRLAGAARGEAGPGVHVGVVFTTDASYRQGAEVYEDHAGLVLGVECECATAAVVGARLGLSVGALLFCTDNVALADEADRRYRGLADPRVRTAFETGLDTVVKVLGPG